MLMGGSVLHTYSGASTTLKRQFQPLAPMGCLAALSFTSATACTEVFLNHKLSHHLDATPGLC